MNKIQHIRWCITQCPVTDAERTIWWFLNGNKNWDVFEATYKYNFIGAQLRG